MSPPFGDEEAGHVQVYEIGSEDPVGKRVCFILGVEASHPDSMIFGITA